MIPGADGGGTPLKERGGGGTAGNSIMRVVGFIAFFLASTTHAASRRFGTNRPRDERCPRVTGRHGRDRGPAAGKG